MKAFGFFKRTKRMVVLRSEQVTWTPSDRAELSRFWNSDTGKKLEKVIHDMIVTGIMDAAAIGDARLIEKVAARGFAAIQILEKIKALGAPVDDQSENLNDLLAAPSNNEPSTTIPEEQ